KEFAGNFDEWETWKEERKNASTQEAQIKEPSKKSSITDKKNNSQSAENREQQKELQKVKRQFEQLEEQIAKLAEQKKKLEAELALPEIYSDKDKFIEAEKKYNQKLQELNNHNSQYEKLFEKLMLMEEQIS
ncbi:MAG TPA: ABC transporter ATP-binding protein, partial [Hanamia sp.]|nr:ABC transporter ATP-binding protein [Hanamia sp.]